MQYLENSINLLFPCNFFDNILKNYYARLHILTLHACIYYLSYVGISVYFHMQYILSSHGNVCQDIIVFWWIIFFIVHCISFFIVFRKTILLKIYDDEEYEKNETFQIHLDEPSIVRRGSGNQFIAKTNQFINYLKIVSWLYREYPRIKLSDSLG